MTEFLRSSLEVYFIENPSEAEKIAGQILINKRSRETAEKARLNIKKKLTASNDLTNRVQKFVDCRTKEVSRRELYIVEGDSRCGVSGHYAGAGEDFELPEGGLQPHLQK